MTVPVNPRKFIIQSDNKYLTKTIRAFFHADYVGINNPGNPNYVNTLKNTFDNFSSERLRSAVSELVVVLRNDLPIILNELRFESVVACVVPRARIDYSQNQLLFKSTVK